MSMTRFFSTHRTWEEWCGMTLGIAHPAVAVVLHAAATTARSSSTP